jgi:hypothetical protein
VLHPVRDIALRDPVRKHRQRVDVEVRQQPRGAYTRGAVLRHVVLRLRAPARCGRERVGQKGSTRCAGCAGGGEGGGGGVGCVCL